MATYYVSMTGSDGANGAIGTPWRNISKFTGLANPGDICYVRGGNYYEVVNITRAGNSGAFITLQNYPGETAIINGTGLATGRYWPLLDLKASYNIVQGLQIRNNTQGRGARFLGTSGVRVVFSFMRNLVIDNVYDNGICFDGYCDDCAAEDCTVTQASMNNVNVSSTTGWSGGINIATNDPAKIMYRCAIRRCYVHNTWGEGISSFGGNGSILEDNIARDNYSVNMYLSDSVNCVVQRNIIAKTPGYTPYLLGLVLFEENPALPRSTNNKMINNLVYNCSLALNTWSDNGITLETRNTLVAHNTVASGSFSSSNNYTQGTTVINNSINAAVAGGASFEVPSFYVLVTPITTALLGSGSYLGGVTQDFLKKTRLNPTLVGGLEAGGTSTSVVTITNPGTQTNLIGSAVSLQITASDSALGSLTYSATGLPTGLSIASLTGLISGTLSASGAFSSTISVVSSAGGSSSLLLAWSIYGALAPPWINGDVGTVGGASVAGTLSSSFLKKATGTDVYNLLDSFGHFYQASVKDWVLTCQVTSIQNTGTYSKFGIMLSGSLAADAIRYTLDLNPNNRLESANRSTVGGTMANDTVLTSTATFLKIQKVGNVISRYYSFSAVPGRPNLAIGKIATSSSDENTSLVAANAVDQNLATRWSSAFGDPQWISIDLVNSFIVDRVKLYWEAAYATNYQVQISTDNTNWATVYTTAAGTGGTVDLSFTPTIGKYVRVYGTGRATVYGYSLYEIEVYGEPIWTELGTSDTVTLPTTTYASVFVCSTNNSVSATGIFDNISFVETDPVPPPPSGSWVFGIAV